MASVTGLGMATLLIGIIWFLSGFYKKKVFIRWLIQVFVFLALSVVLITISIKIIFMSLIASVNTFWPEVIFTIGGWTFIAFLGSIYFLINRGVILPRKIKEIEEDLRKNGYEEWWINLVIRGYYGE